MITKTETWKKIQQSLKEVERSKRLMATVMERIKETPQDENKNQ